MADAARRCAHLARGLPVAQILDALAARFDAAEASVRRQRARANAAQVGSAMTEAIDEEIDRTIAALRSHDRRDLEFRLETMLELLRSIEAWAHAAAIHDQTPRADALRDLVVYVDRHLAQAH